MKITAPVSIVVTTWPTAIPAKAKPRKPRLDKRTGELVPVAPRLPLRTRNRYAAEFVGGPHHGKAVVGFHRPDEAIGELIRKTANEYETADEVLDFFASLFGHDPDKRPDEELGRAVRLAAKNPRRIHPGVTVVLPEFPIAERSEPELAGKGGAR